MAAAATATFRWVLQMHRDVRRAAKFYEEGLGFSVNVCTLRFAELQSGPLKLALMHTHDSNLASQRVYSSMLSFTVPDINSTVTKLLSLGAELDGSIKYETHGKNTLNDTQFVGFVPNDIKFDSLNIYDIVAALRCIDGHMIGLYEPA